MVSRSFLFVTMFVSAVTYCTAIKCYNCRDYAEDSSGQEIQTAKSCGDPFRKEQFQTTECPPSHTHCLEMVIDSDKQIPSTARKGRTVIRSCGANADNLIKTNIIGDIKAKLYFCNGREGCNDSDQTPEKDNVSSATSVAFSTAILFLTALAARFH